MPNDAMADPSGTMANGTFGSLLSGSTLILGGLIAAVFAVNLLMTPSLESNEPPLLKPTIPWVGHIIDILRHQNAFHRIIHNKSPIPIASLQFLWGKVYAIWDPYLAQAALRSRGPSFNPIMVEFAQKSMNLPAKTNAIVIKNPKLPTDFVDAIHNSMGPAYLHSMNVVALNYISWSFGAVSAEEGLDVPNLYLWLRDLISLATTRALLGRENPFEKEAGLVGDMWQFEENLAHLITHPFPSIFLRSAYLARQRLQASLGKYYTAGHDINDSTAAQITRARANSLRKYGMSGNEVAMFEMMLPVVGTTNTSPMLFWMICFIFAKPDLVSNIREEVLPLIQRKEDNSIRDGNMVTVEISRFEAECPLLVACYKETLRLADEAVSMRRILEDTTIKDGSGRSYLLKKGMDLQIPAGVAHYSKTVWGEDVDEFHPERFLEDSSKGVANEKAKKNAYIPFGGGRHLCPGRNFAFAEVMAITATLAIGFELEPIGMGFDDVRKRPSTMANAVVKPVKNGEGLGIRLTRRKGWEKTNWTYTA